MEPSTPENARIEVDGTGIDTLTSSFRPLSKVDQDKLDKVPLPAPHRKALQLLYKT